MKNKPWLTTVLALASMQLFMVNNVQAQQAYKRQ